MADLITVAEILLATWFLWAVWKRRRGTFAIRPLLSWATIGAALRSIPWTPAHVQRQPAPAAPHARAAQGGRVTSDTDQACDECGGIGCGFCGGRVSVISSADDVLRYSPQAWKLMSRQQRIDFQHEQLRRMSRAIRPYKLENQKLKTENQRLKTQLDTLRQGQRTGVVEFLDAERKKKPITRTTATKLMGVDKGRGLDFIRQVEREIAPVPPEIAKPEKIPV